MLIRISYINYWTDSQNDRYFTEFIRANITDNIEEVKPEENPDILICSCNGKYNSNISYIKNIKSKIKIFFYGENLNRFPPFNNETILNEVFDLIIGFNKTDTINKKICFPLWLMYYKYYNYNETDNILTYIQNKYNENKSNKTSFCSLVCRHDRDGQRTKIINSINKYGKIEYGGPYKNNVGNIGLLVKDKIKFISKSIFNICAENSIFEGYTTEKIFQAFEGGTIPLYWGYQIPDNFINKSKYIYCNIENKQLLDKQIENAINNIDAFYENNIFSKEAHVIIKKYYDDLKDIISVLLNKECCNTSKQRIAFISYGDNKYQNSKKRIYNEANDSKFFNTIKIYGPEDLNIDFRNKFINILNRPRGGGYWIWKHQLILQELEKLNYNDILVYCDSGCTVNKLGRETFDNYIKLLNQTNKCIVSFVLSHYEKKYTTKEIFDYFNYPIDDSKQIVGGILIMKKTNNLLDMFKLYQKCLHDNPLLITDEYNNKQEGYFIDNRHDQSIFSIIRKKYKDYCIFIDDNTYYKDFNCEEAKKIPFLATRIRI